MRVKRTKLYTIRMSKEERKRAETLAKHYGMRSVAEVIRFLLSKEDRDIENRRLFKAGENDFMKLKG